MMLEHQRSKLVYRILSGYTVCIIDGISYVVKEPNKSLLYKSYVLYDKILDEHKYDECFTKEEMLNLLVANSLWTIDGDKNFAIMDKSIEELKWKLYQTMFGNAKKHSQIRKQLKATKLKQDEMYNKRYQFDIYTVEGLAEQMRKYFVYTHSTYDENDELIWPDFVNYDCDLLERIMSDYFTQSITESQYRELARTTPWSSYWTAYKTRMKDDSNVLLEHLISFSQFYDNVRQNTDCPTDDVINDDDLLDGWVVEQRKAIDKDKKDKGMSAIGKRDAGEIFIPAHTNEDAQKIFEQNTHDTRVRHKMRTQYIQQKGEVEDLNMPDVRREVSMQANRASVEAIKKGKTNG